MDFRHDNSDIRKDNVMLRASNQKNNNPESLNLQKIWCLYQLPQ